MLGYLVVNFKIGAKLNSKIQLSILQTIKMIVYR